MRQPSPNQLGYVEVPGVQARTAQVVIIGAVVLVALSVAFYLWQRKA